MINNVYINLQYGVMCGKYEVYCTGKKSDYKWVEVPYEYIVWC